MSLAEHDLGEHGAPSEVPALRPCGPGGTGMSNRDIVVIGGSSGATAPLKTILRALPEDLPAAVFIVLHIPARSLGILATGASAATRLPVHTAADGMPITAGNV